MNMNKQEIENYENSIDETIRQAIVEAQNSNKEALIYINTSGDVTNNNKEKGSKLLYEIEAWDPDVDDEYDIDDAVNNQYENIGDGEDIESFLNNKEEFDYEELEILTKNIIRKMEGEQSNSHSSILLNKQGEIWDAGTIYGSGYNQLDEDTMVYLTIYGWEEELYGSDEIEEEVEEEIEIKQQEIRDDIDNIIYN